MAAEAQDEAASAGLDRLLFGYFRKLATENMQFFLNRFLVVLLVGVALFARA